MVGVSSRPYVAGDQSHRRSLIDVIEAIVATRTQPMRAPHETRKPCPIGTTPVAGFARLSSGSRPFAGPLPPNYATVEVTRTDDLENLSELRRGIAIRHLPELNSDDNEPLNARRTNPPIPSDSGWNRRSRRRRLEFHSPHR